MTLSPSTTLTPNFSSVVIAASQLLVHRFRIGILKLTCDVDLYGVDRHELRPGVEKCDLFIGVYLFQICREF